MLENTKKTQRICICRVADIYYIDHNALTLEIEFLWKCTLTSIHTMIQDENYEIRYQGHVVKSKTRY